MRKITSKEQLMSVETLKQKTRTGDMREMTKNKVCELAQYLGIGEDQLQGEFFVDKNLICPNCDRSMTFVDFVKTAIEAETGIHSKDLIANILCGRNGHWVTIGGKKEKRIVNCFNCQQAREYQGHSYHGEH